MDCLDYRPHLGFLVCLLPHLDCPIYLLHPVSVVCLDCRPLLGCPDCLPLPASQAYLRLPPSQACPPCLALHRYLEFPQWACL
jgi:hypothetical protein